jgi:benzoyl-CoA-dihydrodiol lyase
VSCGQIAPIFTRPSASGPDGALRRFGTGRKGDFDFERV